MKKLGGDWKLFMLLKSLDYLDSYSNIWVLRKDWNVKIKKKLLKRLLLNEKRFLS
jgi:hypothetical protein